MILPARSILVLLLIVCRTWACAQENILVYGTVRDLVGRAPISDAYVAHVIPGDTDTIRVSDTGSYSIELDFDTRHELVFGAPGKITKRVLIDAGDTPEEERLGGLGMNIEMILFTPLPGKDYSILEAPIGIARYSVVDSMVTWDLAHTDSMRALLLPLQPDTASVNASEPPVPPGKQVFGTLELVLIALIMLVLFVPAVLVILWWARRRKRF